MECNFCKQTCERKFCSRKCYFKSRIVQCPQYWIDLYNSGKTIYELSNVLQKSPSQISLLLRRAGVKMRKEIGVIHKAAISANRKHYFSDDKNREKVSKHIQKYRSDPTIKAKYRKIWAKTLKSGAVRFHVTSKLENKVAESLAALGYSFRRQAQFSWGDYVCKADFVLDDGCVIEVNGSYWHCDPRKYSHGPINAIQQRCVDQYYKKRQAFEKENITVIEVWEFDLQRNWSTEIKALDCRIQAARNPNAVKAAEKVLKQGGKIA
jgi:G:T-mismatch repair DNA endonuclease (very short patch repair protein)